MTNTIAYAHKKRHGVQIHALLLSFHMLRVEYDTTGTFTLRRRAAHTCVVSPPIIEGKNGRYGRLLDIGSGKGGDIKKWKRARLGEVYGIEIDVKNIEYARNLFGKIPKPTTCWFKLSKVCAKCDPISPAALVTRHLRGRRLRLRQSFS